MATSSKSPAFQFYPKDFVTDAQVRMMSWEARGVYVWLLSLEWMDGFLPENLGSLAKMLAMPERHLRKLWVEISPCFDIRDGKMFQPRLEAERAKQAEYRHKQQANGTAGARAKHGTATDLPHSKAGTATVSPPPPPPPNGSSSSSSAFASAKRERDSLSPAAPMLTAGGGSAPNSVSAGARVVNGRGDVLVEYAPLDANVTERAGRFIERYEAMYPEHRKGARYIVKPHRDYEAAVGLCRTWEDDERLDRIAAVFLTTDHKFAEEGSRTIPQFAALASWCDGKLAEWEAKQR